MADSLAKNAATFESKNERFFRYSKQALIVFTAALVNFGVGMMHAWPNVLAGHLATSNQTLFRKDITISEWQMDLVGSTNYIGSIVGCLSIGSLVGHFGRKPSLIAVAIPGIFGSMLNTCAFNAYMIIVGRVLEGITGGMSSIAVSVYASEISDVKIRGGICLIPLVMFQIGGIFTVSLGSVLSWYYMSLASCCVFLTHCLMAFTLTESPAFLAVKNQDEKAMRVLKRLRSSKVDIQEEVRYLQNKNQSDEIKQGYKGLLDKQHLKTIGILCGIFFIHNFSGTQVLRVNAARQLQSLDLILDEKIATIAVNVFYFLGNLLMIGIVDCYGRRRCLMTSLSIICISYIILGADIQTLDSDITVIKLRNDSLSGMEYDLQSSAYSLSTRNRDWVPLVCIMTAAFGYSMGIGTVVFMLPPEMFPTNLRSQGSSVCTMIGSMLAFSALGLYSPMISTLTQTGMYYFFAAVSLVGIPFIYFLLTETSGMRVG